jgi:hypothetical protein
VQDDKRNARLRLWFLAAGALAWLGPIVPGAVADGLDWGAPAMLAAAAAFAGAPYALYWWHVRSRAGIIAAGVILVLLMVGAHVGVEVLSGRGDDQAGLLYVYVPIAGTIVAGGTATFERRAGRERRRSS